MSKRDLRAFMREVKDEIIFAPGPDTILGEDGQPIMLEIKALSAKAVQEINDKYITRVMAVDKRGKPYMNGNEVAFKTTSDTQRATGHILAEALVYPDLKDPELMAFYNCYDFTQMANNVFPRTDEFAHVNRAVLAALGIGREADNDDTNKSLDDVKN